MAKDIYFVGGSKGGVGKSMVAVALLDYLLEKGEDVILIESDTSNCDLNIGFCSSGNPARTAMHRSFRMERELADGKYAIVTTAYRTSRVT